MHFVTVESAEVSAARWKSFANTHNRSDAADIFYKMRGALQKALDGFSKLLDNRLPGGLSFTVLFRSARVR